MLDILLFVLFVLCLSPRLTGMPMHEIIGLFIFIPIIIHVLAEWKWLANYIKRFIKRATWRDRFNLVLNIGLFIAITFHVVSGLVISTTLVPYFGWAGHNSALPWRYWHNQMSTISMFLVGFHLALSWKQVRSHLIKKFRAAQGAGARINIQYKYVIIRVAVLLLLSGIITVVAILVLGRPVISSENKFDDITRFAPTFFHGFVQLFGETFLVLATSFIAFRWLRVRL